MPIIHSPNHLFSLLRISKSKVRSITENLDGHYKKVVIPKLDKLGKPKLENGKPITRTTYNPSNELKPIQKKLKQLILDKAYLPLFVQGGVKKRDNVKNAALHKGNKYFFLTDVRSFFPSINHKLVYRTIVSLGYSASVSREITKLTTHNGELPQGAPTSTGLANLSFSDVDAELSKFCSTNALTYSRFVDDITISGKVDFQHESREIVNFIISAGFSIHDKKTIYKVGPTEITGVKVHNNFISTTRDFSDSLLQDISKAQFAGKINYHMRVHDISRIKRCQLYQ